MFAISIRYLLGRAVATHPSDYEKAEWPPHPDRLFMALVSAWGETGRDTAEAAALRWLESRPAPSLRASLEKDTKRRAVVTVFVPVNDNAMPKLKDEPSENQINEGLSLLPELRGKQARFFPAVHPGEETSSFIWPVPIPSEHASAFAGLCKKVTRLGHSSSLVQCWLETADGASAEDFVKSHQPTWTPVPHGISGERLRVPHEGRFEELERLFAANLRPTGSRWMHYQEAEATTTEVTQSTSFSDHLIVLRQVGGRRFGLESTGQIANALRNTLMLLCPKQPAPEWLSGHRSTDLPSEQPHLAFLPLANVGHANGDGRIMGFALALPATLKSAPELQHILYDEQSEPRVLKLVFGKLGELLIEVSVTAPQQMALRAKTWTQASRRWATVTPIAFDRHPKGKDPFTEIEAAIIVACERVGLKDLVQSIAITPVSSFSGSPANRSFPNLQRKSGGNIHHTHAVITFKEAVRGPLMLGAGRYRGYGFCRPLGREDWP
jgi:CRISPR-associated protein Csb2